YLDQLKIRATDPYGNITRFYYDRDHRLVLTIGPSGSVSRLFYNEFGESIAESHYAKRLNESELRALSGGFITPELVQKLEELKNPDKDSFIQYERDSAGLIIKKIDAESNVSEFAYTSFNQCKLEKIPTLDHADPLSISHEFDQRGNETLLSKSHAKSNI